MHPATQNGLAQYTAALPRFQSQYFFPGPSRIAPGRAPLVTDVGVRLPAHLTAVGRAMLAEGGSLAEIGQVLRHRRPATTAAYTKVIIEALRALARPWPGASS